MRKTVCLVGMFAAFALSSGAATAGDAPRAVDVIENDLVAEDPAVRAKAAAELTDRFPDGAVAVPMLVDLLDDETPEASRVSTRWPPLAPKNESGCRRLSRNEVSPLSLRKRPLRR